jgi:hypothetical protein
VFHGFVVLRQLKGVGQTSYNSFQKSLEAILLSYCNCCIENCDLHINMEIKQCILNKYVKNLGLRDVKVFGECYETVGKIVSAMHFSYCRGALKV